MTAEASRIDQIGGADSANQGTVTARQLENRPRSRTAEMLEAAPRVIVTQHPGDGKANQFQSDQGHRAVPEPGSGFS